MPPDAPMVSRWQSRLRKTGRDLLVAKCGDVMQSTATCHALQRLLLFLRGWPSTRKCNATQGKAEQSTARSTTWATRNKRNVLSNPRRACATPAPTVRYTRFDPFDLVARHEANMPGTCSYLESQAPDTRAGRTGTVCI